jgi:hypothetical protein
LTTALAPALFVAGDFTAAGGVTVNRIAKWNGATWSALSGPSGVGVNNSVYEMVVFDDGTGSGSVRGRLFSPPPEA